MKTLTVEQGTLEWMQARLGMPTASQYDRLLTPKTRKPAAGRESYRAELLAEWLLGQPLEWGSTGWTERGTDLEDEARSWYEMMYEVEVDHPGFIARDDGLTGGSPDGLVGIYGGLEIKCLSAAKHVAQILDTTNEHVGQVQGYLYLTGREWWDVLYYHPDLPKAVLRVEVDEEWRRAFVPVLEDFIGTLEADKITWGAHRVLRPWHPEMQAMMAEANK